MPSDTEHDGSDHDQHNTKTKRAISPSRDEHRSQSCLMGESMMDGSEQPPRHTKHSSRSSPSPKRYCPSELTKNDVVGHRCGEKLDPETDIENFGDTRRRSSSDRASKRDRDESSSDVRMSTKVPRNHDNSDIQRSEIQRLQNIKTSGSLSLATLASKIKEVVTKVDTRGKDIVALLGGTGVGKTTTIDFCCGAKIIQVSSGDDEYGDSVLDVDPAEAEKYLKIGHGSSQTKTIDFLSSSSKKKCGNLLFCDMPGSGDTNAMDKIVNCVLRSQALMGAGSVRPVLVIKQKDFKAGRCKISKSDIEFTASCFKDAKYFSQILVLITHAEESDEERTIGKLRSYLKDIPTEEPWVEPLAAALHGYLIEQCDKAVNELKRKRENSSNLRVVRPLHPENREVLLEFIGSSWAIESPEEALCFNLEKDADKLVNSVVTEESQHLCKWLDESFEFDNAATLLLNLNAVLQALGKNDQFRRVKDRVTIQNVSLFNDIKRLAQSILYSPLESIDLKILTELFGRFQDLQVIRERAGNLIADGWKSVEMLIWDCNDELMKYIQLENGKGSWDALEGCIKRVKLLGSIFKCQDAEQRASTNVLEAIKRCSDVVHLFQDPVSVADALIDLRGASSSLTGELQAEADSKLGELQTFVFAELDKLVEHITQKVKEIENSNVDFMESDKLALHRDVTKLYKFTRPDQRIDSFLPDDARSYAEAGFYKRFISELKLDVFRSAELTKQQLLQHFSVLACLIQVEDDELNIKLNLHMSDLKAQIELFLDKDFKCLDEYMSRIFFTEGPKSDSQPADVDDLLHKINCALIDAGKWMQFDSINRERLCSAQFIQLFELYLKRLSEIQIKAKRGLSTVASIEQCVPVFFICQQCSLPETITSEKTCLNLKQVVVKVQCMHTDCKNTIETEAVRECIRIEVDAQNNSFNFDTTAGLLAFDEALVKLDLLLKIAERNCSGENARCLMQQQFSVFLEEQKRTFREQAALSPLDVDMDCLIASFNNLMLLANAVALRKVVIDKQLLGELARDMKRVESELVAYAEEGLDHGEATRLYQKISRLIRWKNFEGFESNNSQTTCLKDIQDRVRLLMDKNIKDIKIVLDEKRFNEVASFLDQCSKTEKNKILNEATADLKQEMKILKKYAHQISWLDFAKIQDLGQSFEIIQECLDSMLLPALDEKVQKELQDTVDLVRSEVGKQSLKFKEILEKIIAKKASYNDCEAALQVLVGLRQCLPEYFQDAADQFENHKLKIREKFDSIEKSDDAALQQVANDVIDTMCELNLHAAANEQTWKVFNSSWHSVRKQLEPHLIEILQKMKGRAKVLVAEKEFELATKLLNTHDKVHDYALRAGVPLVQISDAKDEIKAIIEMQNVNVDLFRSNLKRGNYESAAKAISEFTNDMLVYARSALEDRITELLKDVDFAIHEPGQQSKLQVGKSLEHLKSIKTEFCSLTPLQSLISNLEDSLKDIFDHCVKVMGMVSAELHKLSTTDVLQPLSGWSIELEKVKRFLKFPQDVIAPNLNEIVQHVHSFGNRIQAFVKQQINDVLGDAKCLQLHLLQKVCNNLEAGIEILGDMEEIVVQAGKPFGFSLSNLASESRETLLQALVSKSKDAVALVQGGISDKNALSKLLGTLHQAATDEKYASPFQEATTEICKIFEERVENARDAWIHKDDGWNEQINTILHTLHLGKGAFQEALSLQQMATDCMNKVLKLMKDDIDAKEREIFGITTRSCGEIARKLLDLRGISGNVDLMHKYTTDAVKRILTKLEDSFGEDKSIMTKLGDSLTTSDNPLGKSIISENPHVFQRMSNMLYNKHMKEIGATLGIKQVIKNLIHANPNESLDASRLEVLYGQYASKYDELVLKFIKNTTSSLQSRQTKLVNTLREQVLQIQQVDTIDFLATVCALYSFCKSAKYYDSGADDCSIVRPHEIQITSIVRLLGMDSKGSGFFQKLWNSSKRAKGGKQQSIENHFLEIPTGEGKSIILGITACIFALQGWQVDCVCYSKYLSTRDEKDFQEMFEALKLVSSDVEQIRYMTFPDLCERHIEGIRDNVKSLIFGNQTKNFADPTQRKRVLLIDEADVFFTKRFYGNRHSPGFLLRSPEVNALIRHIWTNRHTWSINEDVLQTAEYLDVVKRFSRIEKVIEISALSMVRNVQDMSNPKFEWTINRDGKLGYVVAGEFNPASKFRHRNRTVFAFLLEREKGNPHVTERDLDEMLGIDIQCGDFSYAALPTRYYSLTFGVSGTLTTLLKEEKSLLQSEYKITKNTVIPSAYGSQQGRLDFKFENPLQTMILGNESEWQARIEKEIGDAVAIGRPVLVCFKNDKALQCFVSARSKYEHAKRLDSNLDESDLDYINGIVINAMEPGSVTLLTRKYGRGLDFKPRKASSDKGGVLVIQTFFSSAESEEIQIMGRTARQGEKGAYRLIMCSEHLKDKFGFDYSDQMPSASLRSLLGEARSRKMKGKFDARAKSKLEADAADSKSWQFANSLYGPGTVEEKLDQLVSFSQAFSAKPTTFILMLDVSGSMKNHYSTLLDAFNSFTSALIEHGHGKETLLTVIAFDDKVQTLFRDQPVTCVQPLPAKMPGGGGTSFSAAFRQCRQELAAVIAADSSRTATLLFMTDGEDKAFNVGTIQNLIQAVGAHIEAYNSIEFGTEEEASEKLEEVMAAFEDAGIPTRSIAPSSAEELVEAFASAASDAALHMQ